MERNKHVNLPRGGCGFAQRLYRPHVQDIAFLLFLGLFLSVSSLVLTVVLPPSSRSRRRDSSRYRSFLSRWLLFNQLAADASSPDSPTNSIGLIRVRSESSSIKDRLSRFSIFISSIPYRVIFFLSLSHRYRSCPRKKRKDRASRARSPTSREWKPATSWNVYKFRDYLRQRDSIYARFFEAHRVSVVLKAIVLLGAERKMFAGVQRCADVVIDFQRLLMACNGMNLIARLRFVRIITRFFSRGLNIFANVVTDPFIFATPYRITVGKIVSPRGIISIHNVRDLLRKRSRCAT